MKLTPTPILVLMAMGSPIALNALLPALPLIANDFSVTNGVAQLSLSMYLAALALGQLCLGGLINAKGLKNSLLIGLICFVLGSILGMLNWTIEILLAGRVLQGLGGAVMISGARALLVENYGFKLASQKMGYIVMAIALSQGMAPLLGSYITGWFGWSYIFVLTSALGAVLYVLTVRYVELGHTNKKRLSLKGTIQMYQTLLMNTSFRRYASANTLLACCFYFFVSASPHITASLAAPAHLFGYWFMSITLSFMLGGFLSTHINRYMSIDQGILLGNIIALLGAVILLIAAAVLPHSYATLFIPMSLVTLGRGITQPSYQAVAIGSTDINAGMAAGLMGFLQLAFGALCAQISPFLVASWELSIALAILLCSSASMIIHYYAKPKEATGLSHRSRSV